MPSRCTTLAVPCRHAGQETHARPGLFACSAVPSRSTFSRACIVELVACMLTDGGLMHDDAQQRAPVPASALASLPVVDTSDGTLQHDAVNVNGGLGGDADRRARLRGIGPTAGARAGAGRGQKVEQALGCATTTQDAQRGKRPFTPVCWSCCIHTHFPNRRSVSGSCRQVPQLATGRTARLEPVPLSCKQVLW